MVAPGSSTERLDRRAFLAYAGITTATLTAGCQGTPDDSDGQGDGGAGTGTQTTTSAPGDVTQGGHFRLSYIGSPDNLNPLEGVYPAMIMGDWMYSKLVTFDHNLEIQPDLATDWETNDKGDVWTFHLRDDARFVHNGNRVLAEDVKASIETILDPDVAPGAQESVGPVKSVAVIDDQTVELTLEHPYLELTQRLAKDATKILPKDVLENKYDSIATTDYGSGPFVVEDYEHGNFYEFTAYEDYYKTDDQGNDLPYVDRLTWSVETDPIGKINALKDQRLDAIQRLSVNNLDKVKNDENLKVARTKYGQWLPIVLTATIEPLGNVNVRQAMKAAVDKEAMAEAAEGYATVSQDQPIGPTYKYHADLDEKFGTTSDMDQARTLLDEAGYSDGFELPPLYYSKQGNPLREPIALLFQEQMSKLGIEFELQVVTSDRWISEMWNTEEYWYISNWGLYLVEDAILMLAAHSDGPWNEMKWSNKDFDSAVEQAMRAQSEDEKAKLYKEAQRILRNRGAWIIPFFKDRLGGRANYVKGYNVEPTVTRALVEPVHLTEDAPNPPS